MEHKFNGSNIQKLLKECCDAINMGDDDISDMAAIIL
jgi:hypothetical protein